MKRETLQSILRFLVRTLTRTRFEGLENLPREGGVLLVTNHISQIDALVLFVQGRRQDVTALVTDKYQKYPFFRWVLNTAGVIWIDREKADFAALRAAVEALRRGVTLGIAPEGTRSRTAELAEGKPGTALVADKIHVPIVPVGIIGTEKTFRTLASLRRPEIVVRFGEPFTLPPLDRNDREGWLQRSTDEIMTRIAALLPAAYRGYYRDHPMVKALEEKRTMMQP